MALGFEVLGRRHLSWLMELRNENREWFMDDRKIPSFNVQQFWFSESCNEGDLNLVITVDNERVGFISVYNISGGGATIGRMMVADKHKRKGYMTKAMINVFRICKYDLNIETLTLEVKTANIPARQLYTILGFTTIGYTTEVITMRKVL